MIPSVNANDKDYWQNVRRKVRERKALEYVREKIEIMPVSSVFEQYVEDCLDRIQIAARQAKMSPEDYSKFKRKCSALLKLPELLENEHDIRRYSQEAMSDAMRELYGDE